MNVDSMREILHQSGMVDYIKPSYNEETHRVFLYCIEKSYVGYGTSELTATMDLFTVIKNELWLQSNGQ